MDRSKLWGLVTTYQNNLSELGLMETYRNERIGMEGDVRDRGIQINGKRHCSPITLFSRYSFLLVFGNGYSNIDLQIELT